MIVGRRIEQKLRELGMSQAELARRIRVDQSTINFLVRGKSQSSKHLHRIAQELRTTAAYLAGETDDDTAEVVPEDFTSEEREWIDLLRTFEPEDRKAMLRIARKVAPISGGAGHTIHDQRLEYRG